MKNNKQSTYEIRTRAVAAVDSGATVTGVANSFGVDRSTLHRWLQKRNENRASGLQPQPRSGRPRISLGDKENLLVTALKKPATEFGYESSFWTCRRIIEVAKRHFKVSLSQPTMWRRLREAGLSYKKPEKRFFGQDAELKQEWIKRTIPKIKKTMKKYGAVLYFEDEASVSLAPMIGKTWSVRGQRAFVEVTGNRGSISAMSAISTTGQLLFSLHDKKITSNEVIEFLTQILRHHPRRHVVVVMDQAPPHTSKKVKHFISTQRRLHVFYLPPYSPDLNPDEKVWNYLKHEALKNHQAKNKTKLKKLTRKKLKEMSNDRSLLKALFFRSCVAEYMN